MSKRKRILFSWIGDTDFRGLAPSPQDLEGFQDIIGDSKAIRLAVGRAQRAALWDVSVLLLGESGTGKELFDWAIHNASSRKGERFIALNCAAFPESLIESELFGHAKGAFTGAVEKKDGAFKLADGGTLFLDEIGECPPVQQAKLLRVLQPPPGKSPCCREFTPIGDKKPIQSSVRVIAATNRDLIKEISEGRFREDLYYRLGTILVELPPLRERKKDIIPIAESILDKINRDFKSQVQGDGPKKISEGVKKFIKGFDWPGNVRQLNNVLLQAAVLSAGSTIQKHEIEESIVESKRHETSLAVDWENGFPLSDYLGSIEKELIRKALRQTKGNIAETARLLGFKSPQTLGNHMEKLEIHADDFR